MTLRAVIADDEPKGRLALRTHCSAHPEIELVAECSSGAEVLTLVRRERPDLLFLDVQMRPMSGLDVVAALGPETLPHVVFVTAYDRYAVQAFDLNAVDYLLKPFDAARFTATLARVRARVGLATTLQLADELRGAVLAAVAEARRERSRDDERLVIEVDANVHFVEPADVEYVEADGNYCRLHVRGQDFAVRTPINDLEARLSAARFLRVHRSVIVNTAAIRRMEKWFHGEYRIQMANGREFTSGRTYRQRIQGFVLRSRTSRTP